MWVRRNRIRSDRNSLSHSHLSHSHSHLSYSHMWVPHVGPAPPYPLSSSHSYVGPTCDFNIKMQHHEHQISLLSTLIEHIDTTPPRDEYAYRLAVRLREHYQQLQTPTLTWKAQKPLSIFEEYEGPHDRVCTRTCQYVVRDFEQIIGYAIRSYVKDRVSNGGPSNWVWTFEPEWPWKVWQLDADSLTELKTMVKAGVSNAD